jgi:Flp pilus assembly protein TadD
VPTPDAAGSTDPYTRGIELANSGRFAEAEAAFFEAARQRPKASLGWLSAAMSGFPVGHYEQAATAIEWALHAVPIRDTPETRLAIACYESGDLSAAKREFEALIVQGAPESTTEMFMALVLLKMGQPDRVLPHLKQAYSHELAAARQ